MQNFQFYPTSNQVQNCDKKAKQTLFMEFYKNLRIIFQEMSANKIFYKNLKKNGRKPFQWSGGNANQLFSLIDFYTYDFKKFGLVPPGRA